MNELEHNDVLNEEEEFFLTAMDLQSKLDDIGYMLRDSVEAERQDILEALESLHEMGPGVIEYLRAHDQADQADTLELTLKQVEIAVRELGQIETDA